MKSFWQKLKRPFFCLAPMADVTDPAFRRIIAKYSSPQKIVLWTEFVSADGLCFARRSLGEGGSSEHPLFKQLLYSEKERPIVAQIFGANPETIREAARIIAKLGFDGLDLNMGCPDRRVEKQGAGAALMKNPKLAREIIRAAKEGVQNKIPVSVKTRLGYNRDELDPPAGGWLPEILAEEPVAVTIHARTRKEMSKVPARWERIRRAVEIRDRLKSKTLIIGNGDVLDLADARKKAIETGADGIMFGRAIFGNPLLFSKKKRPEGTEGRELLLKVLAEHTKLFEKLLGKTKSFAVMKKHFKAYVSGWDGAKELRAKLMEANCASDLVKIIRMVQ